MNQILAGLRIVEGAAFVAAPSSGMTLAQLGAEVIRFDQIGGGIDFGRWPLTAEGRSLYWAGLNKGKKSIAVDLRRPEGRELVTALIAAPGPGGGIFLTNFPARGWMSYDALRKAREDLILVNIMGNRDGTTAVDYTVNCALGFPFVTGPKEVGLPGNHVLPAWDVITGQTAALGLLAAERYRTRTGTGQEVTVALSDVAIATVAHLGYVAEVQINKEERHRFGNDIYGAFGRDFVTSDGRRVMVAAISWRQWQNLVEATGLGEEIQRLESGLGLDFRKEGDRFQARGAIASLIEPWCATRTLDEIRESFDAKAVCWGPYQSFTQLVNEDPRCSVESPLFEEVEQPGIGRYLMPGSPLEFAANSRIPVRPAPLLGQHTDEVISTVLGLGDQKIGELHDRGIIAGPEGQ